MIYLFLSWSQKKKKFKKSKPATLNPPLPQAGKKKLILPEIILAALFLKPSRAAVL